MVVKCSMWIWIGEDNQTRTTKYVIGESAVDLYSRMHARDFFGQKDPYMDYQLVKNRLTVSDIQKHLEPGDTWDDAVRKTSLKALNSREIARMIKKEISPKWSQIKLVEIDLNNETVYDYGFDRKSKMEQRLEVPDETEYVIKITGSGDEKVFRKQGPLQALSFLADKVGEANAMDHFNVDRAYMDLRYLYPGQTVQYALGDLLFSVRSVGSSFSLSKIEFTAMIICGSSKKRWERIGWSALKEEINTVCVKDSTLSEEEIQEELDLLLSGEFAFFTGEKSLVYFEQLAYKNE